MLAPPGLDLLLKALTDDRRRRRLIGRLRPRLVGRPHPQRRLQRPRGPVVSGGSGRRHYQLSRRIISARILSGSVVGGRQPPPLRLAMYSLIESMLSLSQPKASASASV